MLLSLLTNWFLERWIHNCSSTKLTRVRGFTENNARVSIAYLGVSKLEGNRIKGNYSTKVREYWSKASILEHKPIKHWFKARSS